jgi:hypothetical protein
MEAHEDMITQPDHWYAGGSRSGSTTIMPVILVMVAKVSSSRTESSSSHV